MQKIDTGGIDLIISSDVLEHIPARQVEQLFGDMWRIMRDGGLQSHFIVLADHLVQYDRSVHLKNYLRYDDVVWIRLFENEVQYINRIQRSQWIHKFQRAGFEIVANKVVDEADVSGINISSRFRGYD